MIWRLGVLVILGLDYTIETREPELEQPWTTSRHFHISVKSLHIYFFIFMNTINSTEK